MKVRFWDPMTDTERILTIADIEAQDWETISADKLLSQFPSGTSYHTVISVLIDQLANITKRVRSLEDQVVDKMLLEDKREL
jgi:hypothetical protein